MVFSGFVKYWIKVGCCLVGAYILTHTCYQLTQNQVDKEIKLRQEFSSFLKDADKHVSNQAEL
jgi:hypothetical protein